MMSAKEVELGASELEVLRVLWEGGPATVRQVLESLGRQGRRLAYTTVQTFLARLEQKGCVRSDKTDLAYTYTATLSRAKVTRRRLQSLLDQLYDGAAGPLVLQLLRTQQLKPEEILELQRLIEHLDQRGKP